MTKRTIVVSVGVMFMLLIQGCKTKSIFHYAIDVPYVENVSGVSAASAIAMWALYDETGSGELFILPYILDENGTVNHNKMIATINAVTNSLGYLSRFPGTDEGQNKAISGVTESLRNKSCSILPLINEEYVPVVVSHGQRINNEPVAEYIYYHGIDGPDQKLMASYLKHTFYKPINGEYIVFLGRRIYENNGLEAYNWFKENNGTYYGAPSGYKPNDKPVL